MATWQENLEELTNDTTTKILRIDGKMSSLQTNVEQLTEANKGTADEKQEMQNLVRETAKSVDEIREVTEKLRGEDWAAKALKLNEDVAKLRKDFTGRQDEFEAKLSEQMAARRSHLDSSTDWSGVIHEGVKNYGDREKIDNIFEEIASRKSSSVAEAFIGSRPSWELPNSENFFFNKFVKTITSLAASAGDLQIPIYEPTILAPGVQPVTLLDIIPRVMTDSPLVYWVFEVLGSRTDGVAWQSLDFTGTDQGTALGTSDFVFDSASSETRTIGTIAKAALQMLADKAQLQAYIENQLRYLSRYKLEGQVLKGNGSGKNLSGINTTATAYDTDLDSARLVGTPNTGGIGLHNANVQIMDILRIAKLQCDLTFFPATNIVLNQKDVAAVQLKKNSDREYLFVTDPNNPALLRPWGLPVLETTQQGFGEFTVGALNHVELMVRKNWDLMMSTENDTDFEKLLATFRISGRFGLKKYRPASIIKGDFFSAGDKSPV